MGCSAAIRDITLRRRRRFIWPLCHIKMCNKCIENQWNAWNSSAAVWCISVSWYVLKTFGFILDLLNRPKFSKLQCSKLRITYTSLKTRSVSFGDLSLWQNNGLLVLLVVPNSPLVQTQHHTSQIWCPIHIFTILFLSSLHRVIEVHMSVFYLRVCVQRFLRSGLKT